MEALIGYRNLEELVGDRLNKLTTDVKLLILMDLLEVLEALAKAGYSHNDIKLDNILINNKNEIKIVDFANAQRLDSNERH